MRVPIVGGGSAGITVAARLRHEQPDAAITVLDPAERRDYQPLWTLVGGGLATFEETERREKDLIPDGVTWLADAAESFLPEESRVVTVSGKRLEYDQLVVAAGLRLALEEVAGLKEALDADARVWTNYHPAYVKKGKAAIDGFSGGQALFTPPRLPAEVRRGAAEDHVGGRGVAAQEGRARAVGGPPHGAGWKDLRRPAV